MVVERSLGFSPPSGGSVLTVDGLLPRLSVGIVLAWVGVAATTSGVRSVTDWWRVVATDSVSIDEAIATNEVIQIQGRVRRARPNDAVTSPISNTACVAYRYNITKQVQGTGDPSIDSDITSTPFIISDGTADILIDPDKDNLSLNTTTRRVTSKTELLEQVDEERLDVDPSGYTWDSGELTKPVELIEGSIGVGETVTVVGKATPVPERAPTDADAVMTSEGEYLLVMNDDPGETALRKVARGGFLLMIGSILCVFAILVVTTAILGVI